MQRLLPENLRDIGALLERAIRKCHDGKLDQRRLSAVASGVKVLFELAAAWSYGGPSVEPRVEA